MTADDDAFPEDPGLAIERTLMAWARTAFAFAGLAALLIRFGLNEHDIALAAPVAALALAAGLAPLWLSRRAYAERSLPLMGFTELRIVALAMVAVGIGSAAVVVVGLS